MKKQMWAFVIVILTIGTFFTVFITFTEKDDEVEQQPKEVYGPETLEQTMYEKVFTMLEKTPLPTYHDKNGNPFERVHVAVDRNSEYDFLQIDVKDEKTGLEYLYMACDFSFEYDYVKTNGETIDVGNNQEVYKYNTTYAWHDKNTGYYSHVMFNDGMKAEEVKGIFLSFGKSKYDILNQIDYKKDAKVVRPTYAMNGEGIQSMALDYTRKDVDVEESAATKWVAIFETYQIVNSFSYDYTSELINANIVSDKQAARKSNAVLDKENNRVAYTDGEIGSLLISPYGVNETDLTGEFLKVIDSIKY